MSGTQSRLKEFEALRGLSIMLLLALHSNVFDPVIFGAALSDLGMFIASFLLGSFFFLAGFFTEVSLSKSRRSALEFIWSKFIRIFPSLPNVRNKKTIFDLSDVGVFSFFTSVASVSSSPVDIPNTLQSAYRFAKV